MKQLLYVPFFFVSSLILIHFTTSDTYATSVIFLTGPAGTSGSGLSVDNTNVFSTHFNTGVDFQGSLSGVADLSNARFSLSGVQGSFNPESTGNVNQYLSGGTFTLVSSANELLLSGTLGLGSLTADQNRATVFSNQLLATGGLFENYFDTTPKSIQLDFAGMPTAQYDDRVTYENVFTGSYRQELTGYETVQTGTTRTLTGYTKGRLKCLDYHGFLGRNCIPVDGAGHILPQYIGKWLLLGSTPKPTPVYEQIPVYQTTPVYSQRPIYAQVPIYEVREVVQHVFVGWNWNTDFVRGLILSGADCNCEAVPEPASLAMLSAGVGLVIRRKKRGVAHA